MKENGIPKKTRFLWQVRISLIGFIPVAEKEKREEATCWTFNI